MKNIWKILLLVLFLVSPLSVQAYMWLQKQVDLINENWLYTAIIDLQGGIIFSDLLDLDTPSRWQCWEVVNDIFFGWSDPRGMWDSFLSKIIHANERDPKPGFAFVEYIPSSDFWHTWFISRVGQDGTLYIIDSNYNQDWTVHYSEIWPEFSRHNSILYFYDPYKMQNLQTEMLTMVTNNILPVSIDIFILCLLVSIAFYMAIWIFKAFFWFLKYRW